MTSQSIDKKNESGWKTSTQSDDKSKNSYLAHTDQVTISLASADFTASAKYSVKVVLGEALDIYSGGKITAKIGATLKLVSPGVYIENATGWKWGFGKTGLTLVIGKWRKQRVMHLDKKNRVVQVFTRASVNNYGASVNDLKRESRLVVTANELAGTERAISQSRVLVNAYDAEVDTTVRNTTARADTAYIAATRAAVNTGVIVTAATASLGTVWESLATSVELSNAVTTIAATENHAAGLFLLG